MVQELRSLRGLRSGYVLNLYGGLTGRIGNTIHPFGCRHVVRMTVPPPKIWADTVEELETWIESQGGELDPSSPTCSEV